MTISLNFATLVVLVWFQGAPPIPCTIDTGTTISILRASEAARVPLGEPTGTVTLVGVGGGNTQGRTYLVRDVGTRYMGWKDVKILVLPDNMMPFPCLLGTEPVARQDVILSWSEQELRPVR